MTEVSEPTITTTPKRKKISDLTDQEKAQIIAEIKAGKTNEFYDIKFFNNGNCRIVNRKNTKTITQNSTEDISEEQQVPQQKSVGKTLKLSNDQWIIQNIMDIKTENALLKTKLKKYKKRLSELYITADEDEVSVPIQEPVQEQIEEQVGEYIQEDEPEPKPKVSRYNLRRR